MYLVSSASRGGYDRAARIGGFRLTATWTLAGILFLAGAVGAVSSNIFIAGTAVAAMVALFLAVYVPIGWFLAIWPFSLVFWTPLVSVGAYNVTVTDALSILLWLSCLVRLGRRRGEEDRSGLRSALVLTAVCLAPVIGFAVAGAMNFGLDGALISCALFVKRWGIYTILPVAFYEAREDAQRMQPVFVLATTLALLLTVLQGPQIDDPRTSGLLFNPNVLGIFAVMGMNYILFLLPKQGLMGRILLVGSLIVHVLGLALSGSRTGWIVLLVSALFWSFRPAYRKMIPIAVAVVVLVFALPTSQVSRDRLMDALIQGTHEGNVSSRLDAVSVGTVLASNYPFGVGAGKINALGGDYLARYGRDDYSLYTLSTGFSTTDNAYMDILLESGFIGFGLFVVAFISLWRNLPGGGIARATYLTLLVSGLSAAVFSVPVLNGALWYLVGVSKCSSEEGDGQ